MAGEAAVAVRATALVKQYDAGAAPALRGIDLEVARGAFLSVMGPSGSGKSTLLHLLGGLDRPTSGEVEVAGQKISHLAERDLAIVRRSTVGFVFQAYNLVPVLTVAENVALPAVIAGAPPRSYQDRLTAAIAAVELDEHRSKLPSQLSGGQQQRAAVARALFTRPALLLADEPTGNLDSASGQRVLALLRAAASEHQTTVVMVTHDPGAAAVGDAVVLLQDGAVAGHLALAEHPRAERPRAILGWLARPDGRGPAVDGTPAAPAPVRRRPLRAAGR